jgi:hypothetical protein
MICAVRFEGVVCERHASEKDVAVVGRSAMMSYGARIDAFPVVCWGCETTQGNVEMEHERDRSPSRSPRPVRL